MKVWLDVPSANVLTDSIGSKKSNLDKKRYVFKKNVYTMPPLLRDVIERVRCYHRIPKPVLEQFGTRVGALASISRAALKLTKGSDGPVSGSLRQEGLNSAVYMRLLSARAHTKAIYLRRLVRFYQQGGSSEVNDPSTLIDTLTGTQETQEEGKLLGLSPNVLLEKLDPAHRAWEFVIADPTKGRSIGARSLKQWFVGVQTGDIKQPFLVWLEGAAMSLDGEAAEEVHDVDYQSAQTGQGTIYCLRVAEGMVDMGRMKPGCDSVDWVPLDTTKTGTNASFFSSKGSSTHKPSMAYNWTRTKELFMDYHNPGGRGVRELGLAFQFHHSSITSGEFVRCAGMLAGESGKITYIDNNSGHYRPTTLYLRKLVIHLNSKNMFSNDATVKDMADKGSGRAGVAVGDFL